MHVMCKGQPHCLLWTAISVHFWLLYHLRYLLDILDHFRTTPAIATRVENTQQQCSMADCICRASFDSLSVMDFRLCLGRCTHAGKQSFPHMLDCDTTAGVLHRVHLVHAVEHLLVATHVANMAGEMLSLVQSAHLTPSHAPSPVLERDSTVMIILETRCRCSFLTGRHRFSRSCSWH